MYTVHMWNSYEKLRITRQSSTSLAVKTLQLYQGNKMKRFMKKYVQGDVTGRKISFYIFQKIARILKSMYTVHTWNSYEELRIIRPSSTSFPVKVQKLYQGNKTKRYTKKYIRTRRYYEEKNKLLYISRNSQRSCHAEYAHSRPIF